MAFSSSFSVQDAFDSVYSTWVRFQVDYIVPILQFLANACIALLLMDQVQEDQAVIKEIQDPNTDGEDFPMVLIQMPMCNEKEVYQQSIAAVCNLDWPRTNVLVQVLDDSNDPTTQMLIKDEVEKWKQTGTQIVYRHRIIRDGYKAGNLKSAMNPLVDRATTSQASP